MSVKIELPTRPVTDWDINDDANWDKLGELSKTINEIVDDGRFTPDMPELNRQSHHYVFVYGTLRKGFYNHKLLGFNPRCIGVGYTHSDKFIMVRYGEGGYPVAVFSGDPKYRAKLYGEVYKVSPDQIRLLDYLESNKVMYTRVPLNIDCYVKQYEGIDETIVTKPIKAWTYLGVRDFWKNEILKLRGIEICTPHNGDSPYYLFY